MTKRKWAIGIFILLIPVVAYSWLQVRQVGEVRQVAPAVVVGDPIVDLQRRLDSGEVKLTYEPGRGYIRSILKNLRIPESSQSLVFSKSSFQIDHISPQTPRALYFNDDVYVGFVPTGPLLEFASIDPHLGPVFYTMDRDQTEHPKILSESNTPNCIVCHDSSSTDNPIPRLLMLSVLPNADGNALRALSLLTNDQSSLNERWGGWYVTGTHGVQRHLGNMIVREPAEQIENIRDFIPKLDLGPGANVTDLKARFDTKPYPTANSDIVALMVLAHQTHVHNLITMATHEVEEAMKLHPEQTQKLVKEDGDLLVAAMLFSKAAAFTDPIAGTSGFAAEFSAGGRRDSKGRSLKDLDLQHRLLRYPLSYLVYSPSFDSLPVSLKDYVYRRFREIMTGVDKSEAFAHLSASDRSDILAILLDTKPDFKN